MSIRLADILAVGAPRYLATHKVASVVAFACQAILACRTAVLGGHVLKCTGGHVEGVWYNSCRNRSCPRCAFQRTQRWLERQVKTLLGCAHHHVIFTIPHELGPLWLLNYTTLADLLFRAARGALFELAADARYLGGVPGAILSLHTWGQQLSLHPHVHCLVTAGGVDAIGNWVAARRKSFLPAEPLKQLFRGKFLYELRGLARTGRLHLPDGWGAMEVEALCRKLEHKRWNVFLCDRYDSPTGVLNYLGRYLHGGPIGESRLLAFDGHTVTFRYKDYRDRTADGPRQKEMPLEVDEFTRRFLQHIPPEGFHLVRAYGLYRHGRGSRELRRRLREALPLTAEVHAALKARTPEPPEPTDASRSSCSICGKPYVLVICWPRGSPMAKAA